jgi:shikimate kinase
MRIYLIGYMASGKSNLGRQLASKLGYDFVDLDYLFEERFRISVLDFFEKYDESAFRNIEQSLLVETMTMDNIVISTGGGTPCYFDNMQFIKSSGISVYLLWEVPALVSRLKMVKRKRPMLKDIPPDQLESSVSVHLAEREFFYRQADFTIRGFNLDMDKLLAWLKSRMNEV